MQKLVNQTYQLAENAVESFRKQLILMKREKRPSKNILMMFDAFYRITENRPSVRRM